MHPRILIRGSVLPSVGQSVGLSVTLKIRNWFEIGLKGRIYWLTKLVCINLTRCLNIYPYILKCHSISPSFFSSGVLSLRILFQYFTKTKLLSLLYYNRNDQTTFITHYVDSSHCCHMLKLPICHCLWMSPCISQVSHPNWKIPELL